MGSIPGMLDVDDGASSGVAEAFQKRGRAPDMQVDSRRRTTRMTAGVAVFEVRLQEMELTEYSNTWARVWSLWWGRKVTVQ